MKCNKTLLKMAAGIALTVSAASAQALMIQVSQESAAGVGDFDANVLGSVDVFSTSLSIADFYQYGNPNGASYNGELNGGPNPLSSITQGFFVDALDGLHYVVVHDNPNDADGGRTRMTTVLDGGAGGSTAFTVEDDPGDGTSISDVGGDRIFDTRHGWGGCCTDGYAIGALSVNDVLFAEFDELPTGITRWQTTGNGVTSIAMVLEEERRVRYNIVGVPEPSVIALLGLGLVGLGIARRKQ